MNWIQVTEVYSKKKVLINVDKIAYIKSGSDDSYYIVSIGGHDETISSADAEKIFAAIGKRIV